MSDEQRLLKMQILVAITTLLQDLAFSNSAQLQLPKMLKECEDLYRELWP